MSNHRHYVLPTQYIHIYNLISGKFAHILRGGHPYTPPSTPNSNITGAKANCVKTHTFYEVAIAYDNGPEKKGEICVNEQQINRLHFVTIS